MVLLSTCGLWQRRRVASNARQGHLAMAEDGTHFDVLVMGYLLLFGDGLVGIITIVMDYYFLVIVNHKSREHDLLVRFT